MAPSSLAALVNVVGFLLGTALYGLLLGTVLRTGADSPSPGGGPAPSRLLLLTAVLGLTWNLGALWIQIVDPTLLAPATRAIFATAVGALGFLPAVVVHSVLAPLPAGSEGPGSTVAVPRSRPGTGWIAAAYALSAAAALVQAVAVGSPAPLPAPAGLWLLTGGFVALVAALLMLSPVATREGRPLWVLALSVFAVSALHLGQHTGRESWPIELVGHHASMPLAVAILLRDYRFALADIFLKRALSLTLVVVVIATTHAAIGLRFLPTADVAVTTYLLGLVLAAVLLQEPARAFGAWVVDTVVLRRPDTSTVIRGVEAELAGVAELDAIPAIAAARLGAALDAAWIEARVVVDALRPRDLGARVLAGAEAARFAAETRTRRLDGAEPNAPPRTPVAAIVAVPTVDSPLHVWWVGPLTGGRRWLSDDVALAESVAFLTARRLDALRVADERYAAALRERQIGQLATEAELRALRAQLNPHFLFNALTTIGYLIQVAPAKAQSTLMRLTSLLRGVLRRSSTEFSRLGDEIALVQAYLEIEEARFEERLRVRIAVDPALHDVMIPSLLIQPLVENAVKHGIAPLAAGGVVDVRAALDPRPDGQALLRIVVRDSGVGHAAQTPFDPPGEGLGLANVAQRLRAHFGDAATLTIDAVPGTGTIVELALPVRAPRPDLAVPAAARRTE
ncbi:MAG: histidine kinase [Vicinamibacteraceae bacterium]